MSIPVDVAKILRERGAVIDVEGTKALYASALAGQSRAGVTCTVDLSYGNDTRHRLDVYQPESATTALRPVLVFVHGGGFIRGDKSERTNVGYAFAHEGFIAVVPNYRLGPAHHWPAGAQDVTSVLQWVVKHAGRVGGDAGKVLLVGESAGAAHVAASTLIRRLRPTQPAAPAAVVLISGTYNAQLEAMARAQFGIATPDPRNEAYFGQDQREWAAMSTVNAIDAEPFPLLISYAELDPPQMQVQAGELFARLVCSHGFQPSLQVVRGHNHLSQLYSIGSGDTSVLHPLCNWIHESLVAKSGKRAN